MSHAEMTVAGALWPQSAANRLFRNVLLALAGTLALAVSAKLRVDIGPVPITMQSFVVLALGAAYGWRLAGATLALYLAEGSLGLPVFANPLGLMGPTGGYLIGFVVAAMLVGYLAEKGADKKPLQMFAAMILGNLAIYALGVAWLFALKGMDVAIVSGLLPFLVGDMLKAALAAAIFPAAWSLIGRR